MSKKPHRTHPLDRDGNGQPGGSLPGNQTAPMATDPVVAERPADNGTKVIAAGGFRPDTPREEIEAELRRRATETWGENTFDVEWKGDKAYAKRRDAAVQTPIEAIAEAEPELVAQVINDDGPDAGMHDTEIADEDDSPTVCEICNIAFTEDDDCLTDITFGPVHAACCGPERESYVNLATGEPLKQDEPLPTPYKYSDLPAARARLATIDGHGDTFTADQIAAGQTPVADQDGEVEAPATTIADDDPLVTIETSTAPVAVRLRELTLLVNARRLYRSPEGYSSNYGAPYIADATADAWVKAGLAEAVPSAGICGGIKLTHEARRALTELRHGVA